MRRMMTDHEGPKQVRRKRISDTIPIVEDDGVRSSVRVPVSAPVVFLHPSNARGTTLDVSDTGMRVVLDRPLRPGDRCVAVVQPEEGGAETHERAEVVWSRLTEDGWMVGLRFVE